MKISYPRYTREENRTCKLTNKQISEIKSRRINGESYYQIAKDYNVTPQAIFYWCLDDEERKQKTKNKILKTRKIPFDYIAYRKRKKELHPELIEYENQFTHDIRKTTRPNYKESVKKSGHKRWIKYREKLINYNKKYQLVHLDKFRKYNKKHREKVKKLKIEKITEMIR